MVNPQRSVRVLVCGGSGLVGGAILKRLQQAGYTSIVATYFRNRPADIADGRCDFIKVDLRDQSSTRKLFKDVKPQWVFLSAARVGGILANDTFKADFIYDNMAIALNVVGSAHSFGVKKLLNLGSSCIYPKFSPQPMKEEHLLTGKLEPTNEPYAIAKICAIKLCRYFNEQYRTNFVSVMPTNLYGAGDNFDLYTSHVLPAFIRKFHLAAAMEKQQIDIIRRDLDARPIEGVSGGSSVDEITSILQQHGIGRDSGGRVFVRIWGSGQVFREFLHVDDLADACVFVMEKVDYDEMRKLSLDCFVNVGTGKDLRISQLAEMVKRVVGFEGAVEHDLSKPDGTPRKLLDVTRIQELGWRPKITLEEGIKKTYKWYLSSIK